MMVLLSSELSGDAPSRSDLVAYVAPPVPDGNASAIFTSKFHIFPPLVSNNGPHVEIQQYYSKLSSKHSICFFFIFILCYNGRIMTCYLFETCHVHAVGAFFFFSDRMLLNN